MDTQPLMSGPRGHWLWGTAAHLRRDPIGWMAELATYGDVSFTRLGAFTVYMVNNPDYIHELLVTQRQALIKEPHDTRVLAWFLGKGLLTNEGEDHMRQRKLMQPAFHHRRIQSYAETMTRHTAEMLAPWRHGQVRNLDEAMMTLTQNIVAEALFGAAVSDEESLAIYHALERLQRDSTTVTNTLLPTHIDMPLPIMRRIKEDTATIDRIVGRMIEAKTASGGGDDLLSMLLQARHEDGSALTPQQIRDEVVTLFLAGHETTSNALTWAMYLLSEHPEARARLQEEVDSVLGDRTPTIEDLPNLRWTDMVIKETMRLYPPAWSLSPRRTLAPVKLGPYTIPERRVVMVSPFTMHRDPRWWPEPLRFDPTRFTPENEKARPRFAYLPFGAGNRICIGNAFAQLEATLILAMLAQRFDLTLYPGQRVELDAQLTLGPKHGLWMQLMARQQGEQARSVG